MFDELAAELIATNWKMAEHVIVDGMTLDETLQHYLNLKSMIPAKDYALWDSTVKTINN